MRRSLLFHLSGSRRIAANTAISYGRTLISIVLVLFSSRWVLNELGIVDFGLYGLVGTVLAIVSFLNTVLANGDARFFALGVGRNDQMELNKVFNAILSLHVALPVLVTFVGLFIGEFVIKSYLVIPPERLQSVIVVFRITLITSLFTMMTVPFSTLFVAYQNILESSLLSLLNTFLLFISAYTLRFLSPSFDKLIVYAVMVSMISIATSFILVWTSYHKYKCTRIRFDAFFDRQLSLSVLKYSFWNMLGDLGHLFRTQGISVIVNLYFGPTGNAALSIANQVSMQSSNLTNAMASSTRPEIYRRAGEGNLMSAFSLSNLTSRIGIFLILIVCVPVLFNLDSLLAFWLVKVPDGTSVLCKCFIFMFVIEKVTIGQHAFLNATGKVAKVNVLIALFYATALVFPFCGLLRYGIAGIGISCLLSMFLSRCSVIYCIREFRAFDMQKYIKTTAVPSFLFLLSVFFLLQLRISIYSENIVHLALNVLIIALATAICALLLLFSKDERLQMIHLFAFKN